MKLLCGVVYLTILLSFSPVVSGSICASRTYSCAILESGELKCWGNSPHWNVLPRPVDNTYFGDEPFEMGQNLTSIDLGQNRTVAKLACASNHACALFEDGDVKCWGSDTGGSLGTEGRPVDALGDALLPVDVGLNGGVQVKDICVGELNSCVLLSNGEMKCWGSGEYGYNGQGNSDNLGDDPGEMGNALQSIDFGAGRTVLQMDCGAYHACAVLDNRKVKCWGENEFQEGSGILGVDLRETIVGDSPNSMGDNLPYVDLGTNAEVAQISAAWEYSCALLMSGEVKCWGYGNFGELGQGNDENILGLAERGQMGDNLAAIDFGENLQAIDVNAGYFHVCAILDDAKVVCWGKGTGFGKEDYTGNCEDDMGDNLVPIDLGTNQRVTKLSIGWDHTCALLETQEMKCWGYGGVYGNLGQGSTVSHGADLPGGMGDDLPSIDLDGLVKIPEPPVTLRRRALLIVATPITEEMQYIPAMLGFVVGAFATVLAVAGLVYHNARSIKPQQSSNVDTRV